MVLLTKYLRLRRLVMSTTLCLLLQLLTSTCLSANAADFSNQPELSEEHMGNKLFEVCRIQVKAKPEKVWSILTDYRHSPNIFPTMKKCELIQERGDVRVMRHVIHPIGCPTTFDYVVEVKATAPRALEWHRVSGSFKEIDTYWKLDSADGGRSTNVTYSSYINGGIFFPSFLVRNQMKDDLPEVLTALKSASEGTTVQVAQRTAESSARSGNARNLIMQPAYASNE